MKIDEDLVVELLGAVSFYTDYDNPTSVYAEYKDDNEVVQFVRSDDQEFRAYLRHRYRIEADVLLAPPLEPYIKAFEDSAIVRKRETRVTVNRRIAGSLDEYIAYSLANDNRQIVVIKDGRWKIGKSSKLHFLKQPFGQEQVTPVGGGNLLDLLRPYVNLKQEEFLLFVVYLVQCFSRGDHFIAILTGQQGTGKSTLTKMIRALIDPSEIDVNDLPATRNDLLTLLTNNFLVCFDNSQRFSESVSDLLCAAVTGVTSARRSLYTTAELTVMRLHNTVVLNGISVIPKKSDFAERSLLFELQKISDTKRTGNKQHWISFRESKPFILGAIFDTLAKAMMILPELKLPKLHRMADAHLEMVAIAVALGMSQEEFKAILDANNAKLEAAYAEQNLLVEAVVNYMGAKSKVSGTATKLYTDIRDSIVGDKSFFPKSASALTRKLNEERTAIEAAGFRVMQSKTTAANMLEIKRIPQNQQKTAK